MPKNRGEVRVGKLQVKGSKRIVPEYPNFKPVVVHTEKWKGTKKAPGYPSLSPYVLKNKKGEIMENIWHAQKVWPNVPNIKTPKSQFDRTTIWEHPEEIHVDENKEPNEKYWKWREKLLKNQHPVRYPASHKNRKNALYSLKEKGDKKLSYVEARKEIYIPEYVKLVREQKDYKDLKKRLESGENLLIVEVDGPTQESMPYYQKKYKVSDDWIKDHSIKATKENIDIMLNDERHSFGHGYCLAMALQDMDEE